MRRLAPALGVALLAVALLNAACAVIPHHARPTLERRWPVMGTYVEAQIWGDFASAARALDRLRVSLEASDAALSNWKEDSALAHLNEEARRGPARTADSVLADCVDAALDGAAATGGAFDPTVGPLVVLWGLRPGPRRTPAEAEIEAALGHVGWEKVRRSGTGAGTGTGAGAGTRSGSGELRFSTAGMELDLGGIGKGCALDAAVAAARAGTSAGILDLGRSFAVWGRPPEDAWRVAVAAPGDEENPPDLLGTLALTAPAFVSTSSQEENSGHLLDPRTGRPADTDVVSATVVAATGTVSDLLSTALFVAGSRRARGILTAYPGARAILLVREGDALTLLASPGLETSLDLDPAWRGRLAAVSFDLP